VRSISELQTRSIRWVSAGEGCCLSGKRWRAAQCCFAAAAISPQRAACALPSPPPTADGSGTANSNTDGAAVDALLSAVGTDAAAAGDGDGSATTASGAIAAACYFAALRERVAAALGRRSSASGGGGSTVATAAAAQSVLRAGIRCLNGFVQYNVTGCVAWGRAGRRIEGQAPRSGCQTPSPSLPAACADNHTSLLLSFLPISHSHSPMQPAPTPLWCASGAGASTTKAAALTPGKESADPNERYVCVGGG